jgi:hypothetical protein
MEEFGVDLAELAAELPRRLNRISEGGLEVHVRTDEMDALLTRIERLGNRVAASVLAATSMWAVLQLTTRRNLLRRRKEDRERRVGHIFRGTRQGVPLKSARACARPGHADA